MLAEKCEKASPLTSARLVAAPPDMVSNCSGLEKSVVGRVTLSTRFWSFGLRSVRTVGKSASPAGRDQRHEKESARKDRQQEDERLGRSHRDTGPQAEGQPRPAFSLLI
jgi:hypothetical protein